MNTKLLLLSFALLLGSGVAAADRRYHPLGAAYSDAARIAQEHQIDLLREHEVCSKNPKNHLCRFWHRDVEWVYPKPVQYCYPCWFVPNWDHSEDWAGDNSELWHGH